MKQIAAMAMVAMMLVMAVPAATAQTWRESLREKREAWTSLKENFQNTATALATARLEFISARDAYRADKTAANLTTLGEKLKAWAQLAYAVRLGHLKALRARAEATQGLPEDNKTALMSELDGYISTVTNYGENIVATDNRRVKVELLFELRDYFDNISVRVKQITAELIVAGFRVMVERAEALASRVDAKIQELKDNGVNTTELETWLANYNENIQLAYERLENADAKIDEITDNLTYRELFKVAAAHVRAALAYTKDALRSLKDIILKMRGDGHTVIVSGSGTLKASGTGTADITGTGVVKIDAIENGELRVSLNANVNITGVGTQENTENETRYTGFGTAKISGKDITVWVSGTNISLHASGTGTAVLTGTGQYTTYGENVYVAGTWTLTGVSSNISTGTVG